MKKLNLSEIISRIIFLILFGMKASYSYAQLNDLAVRQIKLSESATLISLSSVDMKLDSQSGLTRNVRMLALPIAVEAGKRLVVESSTVKVRSLLGKDSQASVHQEVFLNGSSSNVNQVIDLKLSSVNSVEAKANSVVKILGECGKSVILRMNQSIGLAGQVLSAEEQSKVRVLSASIVTRLVDCAVADLQVAN